jgi:inner membrane protein
MSPLTHWQVGALLANIRNYNLRERRLIMLAAIAPDLDGALIFDQPDYPGICIGLGKHFDDWHHTFGHTLIYCLIVSLLFALYNRGRRLELFAICLLSSTLQLGIDVITNESNWKHPFLWPYHPLAFITNWRHPSLWPNNPLVLSNHIHYANLDTVLTIYVQLPLMALIFAGIVYLYLKKGRTFLELISPRLDVFLTDFIALPLRRTKCAVCGRRAYYRASATEEPLCPLHVRFHWHAAVERKDEAKAGTDAHD